MSNGWFKIWSRAPRPVASSTKTASRKIVARVRFSILRLMLLSSTSKILRLRGNGITLFKSAIMTFWDLSGFRQNKSAPARVCSSA